jgi:hypothetical protein
MIARTMSIAHDEAAHRYEFSNIDEFVHRQPPCWRAAAQTAARRSTD